MKNQTTNNNDEDACDTCDSWPCKHEGREANCQKWVDYNKDFDKALDNFIAKSQQLINEHYAKNFPSLTRNELSFKIGQKYVKVISNGSVFSFIDISNGDILLPASWKAPAKHARGNIYDPDFMKCMTVYGPKYLK